MNEFPPEEAHPDFEGSYAAIVDSCIERLALIARDIEFIGQPPTINPEDPNTVINFAAELKARLRQLSKDDEELTLQEQIIESVDSIINQLIALSGLVKQLESRN
jgi:hypothetical protein